MLDAERLSVEQRQIVEIARALLQGTRFIILDEPTAQLEAREVTRLFERIARLQEGGVTFLYISHHLEEIYEVCRSVTVLRDGAVVAQAPLDADAQGPRGRRHGRRRAARRRAAAAATAGPPARRSHARGPRPRRSRAAPTTSAFTSPRARRSGSPASPAPARRRSAMPSRAW